MVAFDCHFLLRSQPEGRLQATDADADMVHGHPLLIDLRVLCLQLRLQHEHVDIQPRPSLWRGKQQRTCLMEPSKAGNAISGGDGRVHRECECPRIS